MPRKQRVVKGKRGWNDADRRQLIDGRDRGRSGFGRGESFDSALCLEAWRELGASILAEHIALDPLEIITKPNGTRGLRDFDLAMWGDQRLGAGSRPWAWWRFDSPERRQVLSGVHPFDDPAWNAHADEWHADNKHDGRNGVMCLTYGVPSSLIMREQTFCEYESQADYLDRLGLWIGDESERCAELWDRIEASDFYRKLCEA